MQLPSSHSSLDAASRLGMGSPLLKVLDNVDHGIVVVTGNARVLFCKRAASRECSKQHSLRFDDRHVLPQQLGGRVPFINALTAARNGRRTMMNLRFEQHQMSLAGVPLQSLPAFGDAAALLVFGRDSSCKSLSVELYAEAHRLKSAESAVLKAPCNRLRPTQIANECGVAVSTVRSHIAAVPSKTGSRSIGDLIRTATVLPAIPPLGPFGSAALQRCNR
jgi:hypothetical protein